MKRREQGRSVAAGLAALVISGVCLSVAMAAAAASASGGRQPLAPGSTRAERLFFEETFRGNGRTCATCHDPINEFTISPELVQARFAQNPAGPLFQAFDSNDGAGSDFSNLLNHALVTVSVPLHPRVFLVDDPSARNITVWRGTPSIANVALTAPFLHDGRAATLPEQALGAIRHHMKPGREPKKLELDEIARFQEGIFYPLRMRGLLDPNAMATVTPGFSVPATSPAAQRGRSLFEEHCTRCHGFELGHRPSVAGNPFFVATFVSDENRNGLPLLKLGFLNPDETVTIVETPDPGRAAITGRIEDLNIFETPMLRGLKHTAPYFHDNSAANLTEVINHYNQFFGFGILREDRDDLITFLELL